MKKSYWKYDKGAHKTKSSTRTVAQSLCDNKKCKFYGKPAAQGVCYSRIITPDSKYIHKMLTSGEEMLKEMKDLYKKYYKNKTTKEWIKRLEAQVVCTWMNNHFLMDELVSLRADNARLRVQLGKWKK